MIPAMIYKEPLFIKNQPAYCLFLYLLMVNGSSMIVTLPDEP